MARELISTGSDFEKTASYSRAVVQDNWYYVAGTTSYNYKTMEMPENVAEQCENFLQTIKTTLTDAGFSKRDVVKANYHITDPKYANVVFPILGKFLIL